MSATTHGHDDHASNDHGHGTETNSSWVWLVGIIFGIILIFWGAFALFGSFSSSKKDGGKTDHSSVVQTIAAENVDKYTKTDGSHTFIVTDAGLRVTVGEYHYYRTNKKVRLETSNGQSYYLQGKEWVGPAMPTEIFEFTIYPTESGETSFTFIKQ